MVHLKAIAVGDMAHVMADAQEPGLQSFLPSLKHSPVLLHGMVVF